MLGKIKKLALYLVASEDIRDCNPYSSGILKGYREYYDG